MKKFYSKKTFFLFVILCFVFANSASAQLPPIISPIQGPTAVCSQPSSPKIYSVSATNNPSSYNWSFAGPAVTGVIISNPNSSVTSISFPYPNLNTTYTLYCSASNNSGTSSTTQFIVNVFETPTITFSGSQFFCQGSSTNLSASPTILSSSSTLTYSWSPSTGLSTTTGPTVNAQPPATTNYSVLLTLGTCTNVEQLTVSVGTCVVGIGTLEKEEANLLMIYPNPSNESFILQSSKNELAVILNEIGQTVRSLSLVAGTETKVSELPGGIYFLVTPTTRKKIVVTK